MRPLVVGCALLIVGCQFDRSGPGSAMGGVDGALDQPDAVAGADAPLGVADGMALPFCPNDQTLVACFQFEGNTLDGSPHGNHAVASASASFDTGVSGQALRTDASSEVQIADSASIRLGPHEMTIEAWLFADELPTAGRVGIVDEDGGPSIFIYANGDPQCFAGGRRVAAGTGQVNAGVWTHVACTHTGTTTTIYVDGAPVLTDPGGGAIVAGTIGMAVAGNSPSGDPFIGRIDSVRVWQVARTPQQVCSAAMNCP
jgi:hypothetical protein